MAAALLMPVSMAGAARVRPVDALFRAGVLPDLRTELFVIGDFPAVRPLRRAPAAPLSIRVPGGRVATRESGGRFAGGDFCLARPVFFELGSPEPGEREVAGLLERLRACGIDRQEPLVVIGGTCDLGPEPLNVRLAGERARKVAAVLRQGGYTVAATAGRPGAAAEIEPESRRVWRRAVVVAADGGVP